MEWAEAFAGEIGSSEGQKEEAQKAKRRRLVASCCRLGIRKLSSSFLPRLPGPPRILKMIIIL